LIWVLTYLFLPFILPFVVGGILHVNEQRAVSKVLASKRAQEYLHREFGRAAAWFADAHGLKDDPRKALELFAALSKTGSKELTRNEVKILKKAQEILSRAENRINIKSCWTMEAFSEEIQRIETQHELDRLLGTNELEAEFRQIAPAQARSRT